MRGKNGENFLSLTGYFLRVSGETLTLWTFFIILRDYKRKKLRLYGRNKNVYHDKAGCGRCE